MRILLILLMGVLFLSGCENLYSKFYDENIKNKNISCVKINEKDRILRLRLIRIFQEEKINVKESCPYTVEVKSKFLSQCSSPYARSVGADFDGFLRFDLKKGGKILYRCQIDWKGEFDDGKIRDLVKKMKEDLKRKKALR
ncbi:MAG TPA: hypothetical protein ENK22_05280 [Persephonella sp.]|nr:hypothetical protein [Persephonella sp.]